MTQATLQRSGPRPVLRFERHLPEPIETVWQSVTDPVEMRSWFPTHVVIDQWKVGAELTHHFDELEIDPLSGVVLEWDPPRRVALTWGTDTIGFELAEAPDGGTTFVLTEELDASIARATRPAGRPASIDWYTEPRVRHGDPASNGTRSPSSRRSATRKDPLRDTAIPSSGQLGLLGRAHGLRETEKVRKQYNFRPSKGGLDAWDVDNLIQASADLPVENVALDSIAEVDTDFWFKFGPTPTVRRIIDQIRLIQDVDLSFPIILGADGRVMDGMHRVARAILDGHSTIKAVRFVNEPEPDYRDCAPEDLPY